MKCVQSRCKEEALLRGYCYRHYCCARHRCEGDGFGNFKDKTPEDWFWEQVDRKGYDECWAWLGLLDKRGYGRVHWNGNMCASHRVAFNLARHAIPEGIVIRHSCDNPPCCNPQHLVMGTQRDNMSDAVRSGRIVRGAEASWSKLTEESVREIRKRYAAGELQRELAKEFGVGTAAVGAVVRRENWKHVE